MRQVSLKFSILLILGSLMFASFASSISAQNEDPFLDYPANCPQEKLRLDVGCQRARLLNQNDTCQLYFCEGQTPSGAEQSLITLELFDVRFHLNSGQAIQQLAYVITSLALGVIAMFLAFIGVYGAVRRSMAEKDEDIIKATKILQNALIGFAIIGVSLIIAQVVASFLGLGSFTSLVDFSCLVDRNSAQCQETGTN